eukprot:588755-Alexandrium_andersonii.AAC.1
MHGVALLALEPPALLLLAAGLLHALAPPIGNLNGGRNTPEVRDALLVEGPEDIGRWAGSEEPV